MSALLDTSIDAPLAREPEWSGRDVYAHLARWQQRSIDDLRELLAGRRPVHEGEDEDALNDRWVAEDGALSGGEARHRCLSTRTELRAMVAGLDPAQWQRFGRLFDDITGPHYEHHLRDAGG